MGVEWIRESSRDAQFTSAEDGKTRAARSWLAKTDSPATTGIEVAQAAPVSVGDVLGAGSDLRCTAVRARANGADGILWTVTAEYEVRPNPDGEQPPLGGGQFKVPIWGASSTVSNQGIYQDRNGDTIVNSAGDPLEDVTADVAEFRLTLTKFFLSHTEWLIGGQDYTNAINSAPWQGGEAGEWKCQGFSAKLNAEEIAGTTVPFWEVNIEFAYKAGGWNPRPWDIGFAQLVNEDGEPSGSGTKRAQIKGQDNKPVRQPVALAGGVAKPAGQPPDVINNGNGVDYYVPLDFSVFGEVYTPGF
jgi:hypothetical protein